MAALGIDPDKLFGNRGYRIEEIRIYDKVRVWRAFPRLVDPPRSAGEKVWGVLVAADQLVALDGVTCGPSRVNFLATVMHKAMQALAMKALPSLSRSRAFDAVCTIGVYVILHQWSTTHATHATEAAALAEQRSIAAALCASVNERDLINALRCAYGPARSLHDAGEESFRQWRNYILAVAR